MALATTSLAELSLDKASLLATASAIINRDRSMSRSNTRLSIATFARTCGKSNEFLQNIKLSRNLIATKRLLTWLQRRLSEKALFHFHLRTTTRIYVFVQVAQWPEQKVWYHPHGECRYSQILTGGLLDLENCTIKIKKIVCHCPLICGDFLKIFWRAP